MRFRVPGFTSQGPRFWVRFGVQGSGMEKQGNGFKVRVKGARLTVQGGGPRLRVESAKFRD